MIMAKKNKAPRLGNSADGVSSLLASLTCILVGHIVGTQIVSEEVKVNGHAFKREKLFVVIIRWIAPVLLVIILVTSVMQGLGIGGFKI